jgi:hypothetical protein
VACWRTPQWTAVAVAIIIPLSAYNW